MQLIGRQWFCAPLPLALAVNVYPNFSNVCSTSLNNINDWTIQLGITRRKSHTYFGQKVKVERIIPHPLYNVDIMHDNDIALIQVCASQAIVYTKKVHVD